MSNAPVALFVYDRPFHTRQTVESLLANVEAPETKSYVFSDAPKNPSSRKNVEQVRAYIHKISGFKSVSIIVRESNFGLAKSIIDGVLGSFMVIPFVIISIVFRLKRKLLDRNWFNKK